ncbi:trypsin-like peptidase domain-containing protein [Yinghuangia sp. YIM S10712]|uniref:S1C family serine protease n=1 Tax=Yinghuangia sp. YIM S10712 TaxID=3436930 RepID=UPI003F53943D
MNDVPGDAPQGGDEDQGDAHERPGAPGESPSAPPEAAGEPSWRPPETAGQPAGHLGSGMDGPAPAEQLLPGDGPRMGKDAPPEPPADQPAAAFASGQSPHGPGAPGAWGFPYVPGQPVATPWAFPAEPEPPQAPMRWTWRAAVGLACLALAAGALGGGVAAWSVDRENKGVTLKQPSSSEPDRPRDSVAGLAATTLPGVVYIHASKGGEQATGTGFVLDTQGYILTNNHVVAGAADGGSITVVFNGGEQIQARIVGRDAGYDLAVIRVENVKGLVPLPLGDSDAAQVGDPVIAIGAPYNLEGTVTAGIISAKERAVSAGGSGEEASYISALQTDAPINPGNSGGPLIDASGRVIGVNSAIRAADDGGSADPFGSGTAGSIGLGFAIPINQAKRVTQQLIDDGKAVHPVAGVTLDTRYEGVGARVADRENEGQAPVRSGGPADRAGVRPGDIITAIDGKKVADANELIVAVRSRAPGETVELTIQRGGGELTVPLTLEAETG